MNLEKSEFLKISIQAVFSGHNLNLDKNIRNVNLLKYRYFHIFFDDSKQFICIILHDSRYDFSFSPPSIFIFLQLYFFKISIIQKEYSINSSI